MLDEIQYLRDEVIELVYYDDVNNDPERVLVSGRWITHDKQDIDNPKCRGRFAAQDITLRRRSRFIFLGGYTSFGNSAPFDDAMGIRAPTQRKEFKLRMRDARKAYFNGAPLATSTSACLQN